VQRRAWELLLRLRYHHAAFSPLGYTAVLECWQNRQSDSVSAAYRAAGRSLGAGRIAPPPRGSSASSRPRIVARARAGAMNYCENA
jgi:hypothetical protein